ncbi:nucleic acid binding protein [Genlisea aurea]|uniref:Nucleic acid binding protein n=1 Tax=Genlisea aurea TaxID=192259 RepID=S8D4K4_9LAMI|nr:nucleic acid binding protein [Genlisea aurea]
MENAPPPPPPLKKRRGLPGMPDPEAEVVALSPKTLLSTNRFVCEICNKGFQRDQNLQLHRRGHNLPWKLRQRSGQEVKKRVYVCPERSCLHHDPARALGDLTGIKKHFCRKHGEKKYNCDRCSKKYAVQSDRKAHMKVCGTREYRCGCGALFSRRDSFVTHRAFCDALAQENPPAVTISGGNLKIPAVAPASPPASSPHQSPTPSAGVPSPGLSVQSSVELPETQNPTPPVAETAAATATPPPPGTNRCSTSGTHIFPGGSGLFADAFPASTSAVVLPPRPPEYGNFIFPDRPAVDLVTLSLSSPVYGGASSVFSLQNPPQGYHPSSEPALSATALLQKAAQIGSTSSGSSFIRGLRLAAATEDHPRDNNGSSSFGLDVRPDSSSGFSGLMMSPLEPTTLDFLGLGLVAGGEASTSNAGFSAFFNPRIHLSPARFAGVKPGDGPFHRNN